MFNVIKADLLKLKWSFLFKFLVILWISFFWLVSFWLIASKVSNYWLIPWIYSNILIIDIQDINFFFFLVIFIIFWFSLLSDTMFALDKKKNVILFTKNIRVKYFLSRVIILLSFSIFVLFFISLLTIWLLYFFVDWITNETLKILFFESLAKNLIFYFSIFPLFFLFPLLNLVWIRSVLFSVLIIFIYFLNLIFWGYLEKYWYDKYVDGLNKYTLLWNYSSFLNSLGNEQSYKNQKRSMSEYSKDEIDEFEKVKIELDMLNKLETLNNVEVRYLRDDWKELPEFKPLIVEVEDYYKDSLLKDKKLDRYSTLYNELGGRESVYLLSTKYNKLKNEFVEDYLVIYPNIWSIILWFIDLNNRDFQVWLLHIILIILTWSIIIKRKEVYD